MRHRLTQLLTRSRRDQQRELEEEIESHLQLRAADLRASGMSAEEAYAEARARFGDLEKARRELYAATVSRDRRLTVAERLDDVRRDLRVALRRMSKRKARTILMLSIFALGIGVTTAMFTVVDNVLLRALPYAEAERLVELQSTTEEGQTFSQVSMGNWFDWRQADAIESTGIYREIRAAVATDDDVVRINAAETGGAFFEALRPSMLLGRTPTAEDGVSNNRVVVLSEGYWRQALASDPNVLSRFLTIDGNQHSVIGVVRNGFEFPQEAKLWTTRSVVARTGAARNNVNFYSLARLTEGVSRVQAKLELDAIAAGIMERDPEALYSHGVGVRPLRQAMVSGSATSLKVLMGAVLLVLLVACVNLMGLTLADGRERTDEVAVRLALGSGRGRLMQQLVTEQVLLGLFGGALGLLLAWFGTSVALERSFSVLPRAGEIAFDGRVASAAISLSLVAGLISGLLPAWQLSSGNPAGFLSRARVVRGGRGIPGASLVVIEIALTVVLLTSGGLLLRSLTALIDRDLGFKAANVVTLDVMLNLPKYFSDPDTVTEYWDRMVTTLASTPGVEAAAAGTGIPTGTGGTGFISLPEDPRAEIGARYRIVSDKYFQTLGVRLLEGRVFGREDTASSERTVVINASMAQRYWPGESALGKTVQARSMESYMYGGSAPWLTVVGVVDDIRQHGFEDTLEPAMFTLYRQVPQMALEPSAVVRVRSGNAATLIPLLKDGLRSIDADLAVETGLLDARLHGMLSERKLVASVILGFSIMALILAALGMYGLLAFAVTARTRELAIRAALGAGRSELVMLVMKSGGAVVALGAALGIVGMLGAKGVLRSLLVDVPLSDPTTCLVVGATLISVTATAVLVPAIRAANLDPTEALRGN